jgi:hypothetical protein
MSRYSAAMQHYSRDRLQITQAQRAVATKAPHAAELQAALENLRAQQQAANMALSRQDFAAGKHALDEMEAALTTIEKLTSK